MDYDESLRFFSESGIEFIPKRNYEFVKALKYSQHLPIEFSLHKQFLNSLTSKDRNEVDGYLSKCNINNIVIKAIQRKLNNIDFSKGFFSYKLLPYPEATSNFVVISPVDIEQPHTHTPYTFTLKRLNEYNSNYFLLEDYKPTTLKLTEIEYPKLSLSAMHKSICEISSLSNSKKDIHIINSIISNYVGSDVMKNAANGIGSSYKGTNECKTDLKLIHSSLSEPVFGVPIQDFGIINLFNKPMDVIQQLRNSCKICRAISFNNEATSFDISKESEFKYAIGETSLNIHSSRDLRNNNDFRESLILYNMMNRPVSSDLRGRIITTATDEIKSWFDKGMKKEIYEIYALNKLSIQIPKIASYFLSFEKKEKDVIELVKAAVSHNISDTVEEVRKSEFLSDNHIFSPKKLDREKRIETYHMTSNKILLLEPEVIKSIYLSDRTEQNIIENIMRFLEEPEEKARKRLNLLHSTGIIFSPDNVHYYFVEESNLK